MAHRAVGVGESSVIRGGVERCAGSSRQCAGGLFPYMPRLGIRSGSRFSRLCIQWIHTSWHRLRYSGDVAFHRSCGIFGMECLADIRLWCSGQYCGVCSGVFFVLSVAVSGVCSRCGAACSAVSGIVLPVGQMFPACGVRAGLCRNRSRVYRSRQSGRAEWQLGTPALCVPAPPWQWWCPRFWFSGGSLRRLPGISFWLRESAEAVRAIQQVHRSTDARRGGKFRPYVSQSHRSQLSWYWELWRSGVLF